MNRKRFLLVLIFALLYVSAVANAQSVVGQIFLGDRTREIACNPVTGTIYIGGDNTASVHVVNGRTQSVVTTIDIGIIFVQAVAVNWITNRVYVTAFDLNQQAFLVVIDGHTNTVIKTLNFGVKPNLAFPAVAVNPFTNRIYIADPSDDAILVMEGSHNHIVASVTVGSYPVSIAINPLTHMVYTSLVNPFGKLVAVNANNNQVVQTVSIGTFPQNVAVDLASNRILAQTEAGTYVLDGKSLGVLRVLTFTNPLFEVNPFTKRVWLVFSRRLLLLDSRSYEEVSSLGFANDIRSMAVDPFHNTGYVLEGDFLDVVRGR